jgi:hypothetical protein
MAWGVVGGLGRSDNVASSDVSVEAAASLDFASFQAVRTRLDVCHLANTKLALLIY